MTYNSGETYGVIFDNHYTDSALKILLNNRKLPYHKWVTARQAVPYGEVLVTMLLHKKIYLSKPLWLSEVDEERLKPYFEEDLIAWIPDQNYEDANFALKKFYSIMEKQIDFANDYIETSLDHVQTPYEKMREHISEDERIFDMNLYLKKILFATPVLSANLKHLRFATDPMITLRFPLHVNSFSLLPIYLQQDGDSERTGIESSFSDLYFREDNPEYYPNFKDSDKFFYHQAVLNDSIISSLAACKFASKCGFPIKSNTSKREIQFKHQIRSGNAEYQLMKLQFENMRYPVVQNINDVLRLRDNKHLDNYRSIISEYSSRLRCELEEERTKVLSEFKRDLELSSLSLKKNTRLASKIDNFIFYISIPVAVICYLSTKLPLSDIIGISLSSISRLIGKNEKKQLDWILFGRQ